jgi:hypothetical protein
MGACSIHVVEKGNSMREAFNIAVEEAEREYGHGQGYSGAINSCRLTGDKTILYHEMSDDEFEEWALDNTDKREVVGYDKGNGSYGFVGWAPE